MRDPINGGSELCSVAQKCPNRLIDFGKRAGGQSIVVSGYGGGGHDVVDE